MKEVRSFLCILPLLCGLNLSLDVFASPVSPEQAEAKARDFYRMQEGAAAGKSASEFVLVYPDMEEMGKSGRDAGCYVFNVGQDEGFVIVSADDGLRMILAYSLSGRFEPEDMPENMVSWIGWYERQVSDYQQALRAGRIMPSGKPEEGFAKTEVVVPALLENHPDGSILYDQRLPYSKFCPDPEAREHPMVTGCVATAMAMLARYHEWPVRSSGNVDYATRSLGVPVQYSLGQEDYDWERMLTAYDDSIGYTVEQADAVAALMRDMGGIVQMDYTYELSSAFSLDVPAALHDHMGYSADICYLDRTWYDDESWREVVETELEEGRPLYYSGSGPGGGHAFVCDGYDNQGYFHFNWGWSGLGNGWYSLDNLAPTDLGTGAGYGEYNDGQGVVVHVKPAEEGEGEPALLIVNNGGWTCEEGLYDADEDVMVYMGWLSNFGIDTVDIRFGFSFWQDTLCRGVLVLDSVSSLPPGYGLYDVAYSVNPCAGLPQGAYSIRLSAQRMDGNEWVDVLVAEPSRKDCLLIVGHGSYWIGGTDVPEHLPARDLEVQVAGADVFLDWKHPGLENPVAYRVYLDDTLQAETAGLSFVLEGLSQGRHKVEVTALYEDGVESEAVRKYATVRDVSASGEKALFGNIRPNPASGMFHVEVPVPCGMRLLDSHGRLLMEKMLPEGGVHAMDAGGLASGIYILEFYSLDGSLAGKAKLVLR